MVLNSDLCLLYSIPTLKLRFARIKVLQTQKIIGRIKVVMGWVELAQPLDTQARLMSKNLTRLNLQLLTSWAKPTHSWIHKSAHDFRKMTPINLWKKGWPAWSMAIPKRVRTVHGKALFATPNNVFAIARGLGPTLTMLKNWGTSTIIFIFPNRKLKKKEKKKSYSTIWIKFYTSTSPLSFPRVPGPPNTDIKSGF